MKDIEYNRLIALLNSSKDSAIIECLGFVQEASSGYVFGEAIPANEVWDIYSKRKAWNESTSNPKRNCISGYEQLLIRLPKEANQKVKIHTIERADMTVMIFTDAQTARLFGSLFIPKT